MTKKLFDIELIKRYDRTGPRYTSYPTAVEFSPEFSAADYRFQAAESNQHLIPKPLSLYFHIPFCHSLCYYCGCTKKVTNHPEESATYLRAIYKEIEWQGQLFDRDRPVIQLHFGGGTPTFLTDDQLRELLQHTARYFSMYDSAGAEWSIEVDPRTMDAGRIKALADMGFNRLSMGVQDFEPRVQKAVNRVQSVEETGALIEAARENSFRSVSIDLIYGLPLQTISSFKRTLETVVGMRPDRISVYNYAHLPQRFKAQRLIREEDIPSPDDKLNLLELSINHLTDAGYVYIGMDHFALPEDDLVVAKNNGTLQRNFQGYSTCAQCDLVGLGVSSIGQVRDCFSQNYKHLPEYYHAISEGRLPVEKGLMINDEDWFRHDIIQKIMCHGEVTFEDYQHSYNIDFKKYFAQELKNLWPLQKDGLVMISDDHLTVTEAGRMFLRSIAMEFDEYLNNEANSKRFSKVI
jgi:oxygen-independent coproporphyrinogen-3 oxidase